MPRDTRFIPPIKPAAMLTTTGMTMCIRSVARTDAAHPLRHGHDSQDRRVSGRGREQRCVGDVEVRGEPLIVKRLRFSPREWEHASGMAGVLRAEYQVLTANAQPFKNIATDVHPRIQPVGVLFGKHLFHASA